MSGLRVAVIGGGWAGLAAAVQASQKGHHVTLFEASRQWGGRARAVPSTLSEGTDLVLDNGQHILIGAYTQTLALMRTVGVDPDLALLRLPLCLQFPDGQGLQLPDWPMPLDVLAGVLHAKGWAWADKWSLLCHAGRWQLGGFRCAEGWSVSDLCTGMSERVMQTLVEPLCVSALNTPADRASAKVFLRVLKDSLLGEKGGSNLLLPRVDLSALFPVAAFEWLQRQGATLYPGHRVQQLQRAAQWMVDGEAFDAVLCATSSAAACQLLAGTHADAATQATLQSWVGTAQQLQFEAITTVYAQAGPIRLPQPMLALHSNPQAPAQFVFDRGQLGGPTGLLAFVVSASDGERGSLQREVMQQAQQQLEPWLQNQPLQAIQTIVEKRATFACTPGLVRPVQTIAPGLLACGDYVEGPYPATLEGAVRSGLAAADSLFGPYRPR